ncbi:SGNH/GDSL hydrolase family protein [Saccharicrinis fermentans]|uniref:GDSL-like lipase/acylhydrolase n=1 Tax=Saccharicrinis fermentans DSM 9555 = JCM 21142 TaxID=869213 RepID=W7Y9X0_9BACT|nr:SGNH/GDSL hydrolase family protein [Saccharicrinis fermentans]GAF05112.1 GDSL-like lipase/acylhydrolase [Saccharicrinis fermentans DSM 9555 = JCM 21142]
MKFISFAFSIFLIVSCTPSLKELKVLHNKRVLVLGNSITQNGAYVTYIEYYLRKSFPNEKLDIISIGLSSETVNGASEAEHPFPRPCIHQRLDSALSMVKPDLVMTCYGMNDGIFSNPDEERLEAYKKGIYRLSEKVKGVGAELILMTPTLFDPDPKKEDLTKEGEAHSFRHPYYKYNEVLDTYADWILSLREEGFLVIDWHNYLKSILAKAKTLQGDSTFMPDGVHPNYAGHFLMAKKVLLDLYPQIEMGEPYPTVDELQDDSLFVWIQKRRRLRSNAWLKYVGYVRKDTVKVDGMVEMELKVKELDQKIALSIGAKKDI